MKKILNSKLFFCLICLLFTVLSIILLSSTVLDGAKYNRTNTSTIGRDVPYIKSYKFNDFTYQYEYAYYHINEQRIDITSGLISLVNGVFSTPKLIRKSVFCLTDAEGNNYICTAAILLQIFYGLMIIISIIWTISLVYLQKHNLKDR